MVVQECDDLPADPQRGDIPYEIDTIRAIHVKDFMTVQQFRTRDHVRYDDPPWPATVTVPA